MGIDPESDALFWARRGLKMSGPFIACPSKIIGRCNDLTRGVTYSESAKEYMEYKAALKEELAIPEFLLPLVDGIVIEAEFKLPKSCFKRDGTPNKEGEQRLDGKVKCLPVDDDNLKKPIQDAVFTIEIEVPEDKIKIRPRWRKKDGSLNAAGVAAFEKAKKRIVIRDAGVLTSHTSKRWGLENKITVWLLLPLETEL